MYRAGFATKQEPYNVAVKELFAGLDRVEAILASQRYLTGDQLTEADVRLYTTLARFDKVYVGHFKVCNVSPVLTTALRTIIPELVFDFWFTTAVD